MFAKFKRYLFNNLIALDQSFNTLLGGDPDETITSRAGKVAHKRGWARALCRLLSLVDHRHCEKGVEADEGKAEVIR